MHRTETLRGTICTFTGVLINGTKVLPDVNLFKASVVKMCLCSRRFLHSCIFSSSCFPVLWEEGRVLLALNQVSALLLFPLLEGLHGRFDVVRS